MEELIGSLEESAVFLDDMDTHSVKELVNKLRAIKSLSEFEFKQSSCLKVIHAINVLLLYKYKELLGGQTHNENVYTSGISDFCRTPLLHTSLVVR